MPARPLFWLTVFFMLGISADRLFGESLPVQTHYFAFAALILIAAMAATLWFRSRMGGPEAEADHPFTHLRCGAGQSGGADTANGTRHSPIHLLTHSPIHLLTNFALPALLFAHLRNVGVKGFGPAISSGTRTISQRQAGNIYCRGNRLA